MSIDPERLDPLDPAQGELLSQRAGALQRVQRARPLPEDAPLKKRLFRQLLVEGLSAAGVVGVGTGLGYGLRGLLLRQVPKSLLLKYPALIPAMGAGTAAAALYSNLKRHQIQERRIQRARTILNPQT